MEPNAVILNVHSEGGEQGNNVASGEKKCLNAYLAVCLQGS